MWPVDEVRGGMALGERKGSAVGVEVEVDIVEGEVGERLRWWIICRVLLSTSVIGFEQSARLPACLHVLFCECESRKMTVYVPLYRTRLRERGGCQLWIGRNRYWGQN